VTSDFYRIIIYVTHCV